MSFLGYLDDPSPGMPLSPWVVRPVDDDEFARQLEMLRPGLVGHPSGGVPE